MTQEFDYNDIIEYIDCTYDENFQDAKHWCNENNAQLIELVERREEKEVEEPDVLDHSKTNKAIKLYRYFQIQENPKYEPKPYVPTEDELKSIVRITRNMYLQQCDFTQLDDVPFTTEEKQLYVEYRQYLRDYTKYEDWWKQTPKTFEEWLNEESE